jgi:HopA1 effector protein family
MTAPGTELRIALDSVRLQRPSSFTLLSRRFRVLAGPALPGPVPPLEAALAEELYASLHCRVPPQGAAAFVYPGWLGAPDFAARLSAANVGTGRWQTGWTVRGVDPDGRVVAERHGVRFWVPAGDYRSDAGAITPGGVGAVRIPKEYFELASGFYLAHGSADDTRGTGAGVRVYWHLTASGAERLMGLVTGCLNRASIAFQLKVLSEPRRYHRTDPAVLYLARDDYPRAVPLLRQVRADIAPCLRSRVSLLVKPLAPGIGLADDPGDGVSFGEHRCGMLAAILADPEWETLESTAARVEFVSSRLACGGYDLNRLYLNPGSTDDLPLLDPDRP